MSAGKSANIARALVAAMLLLEAITLWQGGGTWIVPYLIISLIIAGLVVPGLRGWAKRVFAILATAYAILFIAPGAILIAIGACGSPVNGHCSDDEFRAAVIWFAVAATVNITAAVLIWRRPSKPPPPESRR
jgi:hypothetical protein